MLANIEEAVSCLDNIYSAKTLFANFLLSIAVKEWNKAENHVEAIEERVEGKITFDNPQQWSPSYRQKIFTSCTILTNCALSGETCRQCGFYGLQFKLCLVKVKQKVETKKKKDHMKPLYQQVLENIILRPSSSKCR